MGFGGRKSYPPASPKRPKNRRRISALTILQSQLKSGVKPVKGSFTERIPLEEGDIKRIKKIIEILNKKIIQ